MARAAFARIAYARGWSQQTQIEVLLSYVEQQNHEEFIGYIEQIQAEENELGNEIPE
jgi:hypothetical protein